MAFLNKPQRTILNPKRYRYKHIERCGAKSISLDNWRALIDLTGSEAAALDVRYVLMRLRATAHSSGSIAKRARCAGSEPLDMNYLVELYIRQEGLCAYTGWVMSAYSLPLEKQSEVIRCNPLRISLDRIDSNGRYENGNIVLCCWMVNQAKSVWPLGDFIEMCTSVHNRLNPAG
jgi:hypothetical protein